MKSIVKLLSAVLAILFVSVAPALADDLQLYFVHNDHLGTPVVVTDAEQKVVWQGEKTPYGETTEVVSGVDMPIRFPGQYYDEETGLHYNYYRDYDPGLGRYVQSDPIGLRGGINTFGYVGGNPLIFVDFFGLNRRPPNPWNQFQRSSTGQGLTRTQMQQAYHQYRDQVRQSELNRLGGPRNPDLDNMLRELPDKTKEALNDMGCNSFGTCTFQELICDCDGPKYCPSGPEMKSMPEDDKSCYCYYVTRSINM